jgi:molybdopterin synthase sulfur carrier subunit
MDIHIPTPLRAYTDKKDTVSVEAATVSEGLAALIAAYPAMQANLYTPEGKLRSFVNLYLNDDDVRYLPAKEDSPVSPTDELTIIPSIAGGAVPDNERWLHHPAAMADLRTALAWAAQHPSGESDLLSLEERLKDEPSVAAGFGR